jgi:hypothetical protein
VHSQKEKKKKRKTERGENSGGVCSADFVKDFIRMQRGKTL